MKRSDGTAALSWANNTRATPDTRITDTEFRVLCVIAGGCQTRAEISAAAGCSESTVPRAVRKLEKIGALKRTQTPGKANSYVVLVRSNTGTNADTRISKAGESKNTGAKADTGRAVDKPDAHIRNAGACAAPDKTITQTVENNPETPEKVVVVAANSDTPPPPLWQRVLDAVRSPHLDENKEQRLILEGYIVDSWQRAGADEYLDIIPTVRRLIERKGEPVPWDYFTKAVRQAAAKRKAAESAEPITPDEATHDQHRASDADPGIRRRQRSPLTERARQLMSQR